MTTIRATTRSAAAAGVAALLLTACTSTTSGRADGTARPESSPAATTATSSSATSSGSSAPSTTEPSGSAPSTASSSSGPPVVPAPATPLRTVTTHDPDGPSYVVKVWAERRDATCAGHAYGRPMIAFLTAHPCSGMDRLLATTVVDGRPVGLSEVTTSFRGTQDDPYKTVNGFRALVEKDGTGNIDDLLREGYRLPSGPTHVPSPDAFNCLGQDNGVSVYDAWYLDGPTPDNAAALVRMTQGIFLQV